MLSRGLIEALRGRRGARRRVPRSSRASPENRERNLALVDALREIADVKGVTVARRRRLGRRGARTSPRSLAARTARARPEPAASPDAALDADDLAALERAVPPDAAAGDRYPQAQMAVLDSERG